MEKLKRIKAVVAAAVIAAGISGLCGLASAPFAITAQAQETVLEQPEGTTEKSFSAELAQTEFVFTGEEICPEVTVTDSESGDALTRDEDYTVEYSGNISAGSAKIVVRGAGSYEGEQELSFTILPFDISESTAKLPSNSYSYLGGGGICPVPTLEINGRVLVRNEDYRVAYSNNRETGTNTGEVTLTGIGSYTGKTVCRFSIVKNNISDDSVTLSAASYPYTAKAITPLPVVRLAENGRRLVKDTDFTVSYSNNIKLGTATVKITGRGKYTGTLTTHFTIRQTDISRYKISIPRSSYVYTGNLITPVPTLKIGTLTLVKDRDYTVSYYRNRVYGTAKVILTGKGNYTGKLERSFTITKRNISCWKPVLPRTAYNYWGNPLKPAPTISSSVCDIRSGRDFTVKYVANDKPGTAKVILTGTGSCTGTTSCTFKINKLSQGWHKTGGHSYYFDADGFIVKTGMPDGYTITSTGAMTEKSELLKTEVDNLIDSWTSETATKEENLHTCFIKCALSNTYERKDDYTGASDWQVDFAYYIITAHKGNCYKFAAEFCYLARALGFDAKCIPARCDKRGGGTTPHCWVEINKGGTIHVYDPDMYNASRYHAYYDFSYSKAPMGYYK